MHGIPHEAANSNSSQKPPYPNLYLALSYQHDLVEQTSIRVDASESNFCIQVNIHITFFPPHIPLYLSKMRQTYDVVSSCAIAEGSVRVFFFFL